MEYNSVIQIGDGGLFVDKYSLTICHRKDDLHKCLLCERPCGSEYYKISLNFTDNHTDYGRFRDLCITCFLHLHTEMNPYFDAAGFLKR